MALTAEQHSEIAANYANAAADLFVPPEQRAVFARKAEFFRLLAKLAAKKDASGQAAARLKKEIAPAESPKAGRFDDGAGLPKAIESLLDRRRTRSSTESNTPAHLLALTHLALRWRLFRLETETFGRPARSKH
jgi:hypothetical protein